MALKCAFCNKPIARLADILPHFAVCTGAAPYRATLVQDATAEWLAPLHAQVEARRN